MLKGRRGHPPHDACTFAPHANPIEMSSPLQPVTAPHGLPVPPGSLHQPVLSGIGSHAQGATDPGRERASRRERSTRSAPQVGPLSHPSLLSVFCVLCDLLYPCFLSVISLALTHCLCGQWEREEHTWEREEHTWESEELSVGGGGAQVGRRKWSRPVSLSPHPLFSLPPLESVSAPLESALAAPLSPPYFYQLDKIYALFRT